MKKLMSKLLAVTLAFSCLLSAAMASNFNVANSNDIRVVRFEEFISTFFENPNEWHVADAYGNDISDQYYNDNIALYESGNFAELMNRSEGLVDSLFQSSGAENNNVAERAASSKSTYLDFICVVGPNYGGALPPGSEVYVTLTGNYEVDTVNGIITKVNSMSPSVRLDGFGDITHGDVSYSISNVRRSSSFTSKQAEFTASFDIFVTYGPYDYADFCGNYTITIIGGVNGGTAIGYRPDDGSGNRYVYKN